MDLNCRVCLQIDNVMISVFEQSDKFGMSLSNLLQIFCGLDIDHDDEFPKYLCEKCTKELLSAAEFRKKCKKSQELLIKIKYNGVKTVNFTNSTNNNAMEIVSTENLAHEMGFPESDTKNISLEIKSLENELLGLESAQQAPTESRLDTANTKHQSKKAPIYFCIKCQDNFNDFKTHACIVNFRQTKTNKVQNENPTKIFACEYCDKKLRGVFKLQLHQSTHTGERPYHCYICQNKFKTRAALISHQNMH